MPRFIPQSIATTRIRAPASPSVYGAAQLTLGTASVGALCSLSLASPSQSGVSAEVRRAFRVPKSLIDLFSFLVSTPLIPAMPKRSITSPRVATERKFEGSGLYSRTTRAPTDGESDS